VRRSPRSRPVPSSWSPGRTEAPDRERNPRPVKRTVRAGEPASEDLVDLFAGTRRASGSRREFFDAVAEMLTLIEARPNWFARSL